MYINIRVCTHPHDRMSQVKDTGICIHSYACVYTHMQQDEQDDGYTFMHTFIFKCVHVQDRTRKIKVIYTCIYSHICIQVCTHARDRTSKIEDLHTCVHSY